MDEKDDVKQEDKKRVKPCPFCGHDNEADAAVCAECKKPLSGAGAAAVDAGEPAKQKRVKLCKFCGEQNELSAKTCADCRRPLGEETIVTIELDREGKEAGSIPEHEIERFGSDVAREPSGREIPVLEMESATDVLSRVVERSRAGVPRRTGAPDRAAGRFKPGASKRVVKLDEEGKELADAGGGKLQVLGLDVKEPESEALGAGVEPGEPLVKAGPREDTPMIHHKIIKRRKALLEESIRTELRYWDRLRKKEVALLFFLRVAPWFLASLAMIILVLPLASLIFPQGRWSGRIFDGVGIAHFDMVLEREGAQLFGKVYLYKDARNENIPFVLEGVWDGVSPLKIRGHFNRRELELVMYPDYSEYVKVVMLARWKGDEAAGDARNFRGITGNWDMER